VARRIADEAGAVGRRLGRRADEQPSANARLIGANLAPNKVERTGGYKDRAAALGRVLHQPAVLDEHHAPGHVDRAAPIGTIVQQYCLPRDELPAGGHGYRAAALPGPAAQGDVFQRQRHCR
jgi:hypothetical protein